jgi:hypothetical protein
MTDSLRDRLSALPDVARDPVLRELAVVLTSPTGTSSAGWPYLSGHAWARFRDWVPHLFGAGQRVWLGVADIEARAAEVGATAGEQADLGRAAKVVRQVVRTAAVTAPPELWLLRGVLSALDRAGLLEQWRAGEVVEAAQLVARPEELAPDLTLLLGRHLIGRAGEGYRWLELPGPQAVLRELPPLPADLPTDLSVRWAAALQGETTDLGLLQGILERPLPPTTRHTPAWLPTPAELELGWRLVPFVLGLRATGRIRGLLGAEVLQEADLQPLPPALAAAGLGLLRDVGALDETGQLTAVGRRTLARGPGPFGIIETYHPYLGQLPRIWAEGRGAVHVERSANVAASQDANRRTFAKANDALDAFCRETGFAYTLFIEHAVGKGEATRQRRERSGDGLDYVGADLEDAAIDAAIAEQQAGRLPPTMRFVRSADIGRPDILVDQLRAWGLEPEGAVMLVGNGFHEVRGQRGGRMVEVFAGYEQAGIVLLFTEESALAVDDLLETAWNTYHGAFRYVHERSGQTLRPATPRPPSQFGEDQPASWTECAQDAGYVRVSDHSSRSRTIYPYPRANGCNPSISVNHFFVPARIATRLGLGA